jgi:hypothetical protein
VAGGTDKNEENLSGQLVASPSFKPETSKYEAEVLPSQVWQLVMCVNFLEKKAHNTIRA